MAPDASKALYDAFLEKVKKEFKPEKVKGRLAECFIQRRNVSYCVRTQKTEMNFLGESY